MTRAAAACALLLAGCGGLIHKDVSVSQPFQVGGVPTVTAQINGSALTGPLSASAGDLSKLSSVTLQRVTIQAEDSGDVSLFSAAKLKLTAGNLPELQLATLPARAAARATSVDLRTESSKDLRAYLAQGSTITAELSVESPPVQTRLFKITLVVRGTL